jgi:hypothetical protein
MDSTITVLAYSDVQVISLLDNRLNSTLQNTTVGQWVGEGSCWDTYYCTKQLEGSLQGPSFTLMKEGESKLKEDNTTKQLTSARQLSLPIRSVSHTHMYSIHRELPQRTALTIVPTI